LAELGARIVVGTAPRQVGNRRHNIAYIWQADSGLRWDHQKTYLPNDEGYWEANWYDRAPIDFQAARVDGVTLGLMICTEIWFMQHAREYGRSGIHLLLNPRSTPLHSNDKWLAGGRTSAVVSGAYCLSSNHAGRIDDMELGGCGWICDPDGHVLATTNDDRPFVTIEIDLHCAETAKRSYPRYVDDSDL
jgi:N-carbamoylputrescine amidase